ncbi:family 4 glycosyl hydrolase [Paenibacillus plantarum]|uniref:family 4 glycosyl hydrolase n=1 Tax=Paenibacillus plantarum TaxID=2654975 RepID=UPI001491556D|nr:hypothetical protein [Paenibacillus plantarum]
MTAGLLEAYEKHPVISKQEPCRIDVLRRFGYYSTESNGHLSEYLPWYRKGDQERWINNEVWSGGRTAGYLDACTKRKDEYKNMYPKWLIGETEFIPLVSAPKSMVLIFWKLWKREGRIEAISTSNLPGGITVEVPCYVDKTGIHAVHVGNLPIQCAATCRTSISVQKMAVEAALKGDKELVKLAVLHDPTAETIARR